MGVALRTMVAVVGAMALVLGGCGSGPRQVEESVAPIDARSTELLPSGWTLFGAPASGRSYPEWTRFRMVADGRGQVWLVGPWQLIRLDPLSGEATVWDAADDLQFASTSVTLAPAAGSGVWLLDGARVRLFDGQRFAVDLEVPVDVLNVPGGPDTDGWVTDVVQVGSEVWVSVLDTADVEEAQGGCCIPQPGSGGRVVRYSDGVWTPVSAVKDRIGGYLAVDRDGSLWAGGVILTSSMYGDQAVGAPRRWDGQAWSLPGDSRLAPIEAGDVVADPTGGVWFISEADGLRHFDGTSWTAPAPDLPATLNGVWLPGGVKLAVSSDGSAWVAGGEALARVGHDGDIEVHGRDSGFEAVSGLAIGSQDTVTILDVPMLRRLDAGLFKQIGQVPVAPGLGALHAVSANEVWAYVWGQPDQPSKTWFRLRDGAWEELGPGGGGAVVATDGALWTTAGDDTGLVRISSDGYRVIADAVVGFLGGLGFAAVPDGSVWVRQDGDVVRYWPDGRRESIGRPVGVDPPIGDSGWGATAEDAVCLHGVDPDGGVWVSEVSWIDDEECTAGTWHRWDGERWNAADEPDPFTSAPEHVVAGDGIGWLLRWSKSGTEIARYTNGDTTPVATSPRMSSLTAVSSGRACVFEYPAPSSIEASAIVCYDADGEIARFDVAGRSVEQFSIAPDGSIWVVGPQVARLPQTLPAP